MIKYLFLLVLLLLAAAAGLFWLPTGSWLVLPAARYLGGRFLRPLEVRIGGVEGSLRQGYSVSDVEVLSGDETFLTLDRAAVSPDWDLILSGSPWLRSVEAEGLSADIARLQSLAGLFSGGEEPAGESSIGETLDTVNQIVRPLRVSIRDVNLTAPYPDERGQAALSLSSLLLDEAGRLSLRSRVRAGAADLPLDADARLGFDPLKLVSSDLWLGTGRLSLKGDGVLTPSSETPFTLRGDLVALPIETILSLVPDPPVQAEGRLDGRVFLRGSAPDFSDLAASGVLSVPRSVIQGLASPELARLEGVPLSLRVPWDWDGKIFSIEGASLRTKAAEAALDASLDLGRGMDAARVTARGNARNISLSEIGRIAAPAAGLAGEGGQLNFDISAGLDGDLGAISGTLAARLPEVSASGVRLVRGLAADLQLTPGEAPKLSCSGEVFGGKLFGRGEVEQKGEALRPSAVLSLVNLDLASLAAAFPDLRAAKPSGKVSLTARVAEDLSVTGRLTSGRLSAAGVALQDLAADLDYRDTTAGVKLALGRLTAEGVAVQDIASSLSYNVGNGRAALNFLTGRLGRAPLSASGAANVNAGTFDLKANLRNLDPRSIPQLKDSGLQGLIDLDAAADGAFSDPSVSVRMRGRNARVSDLSLGDLNLSLNYAKDQLSIPETRITLPGGAVTLRGNVGLSDPSNPRLDVAASTTALNLARISRALKLKDPVTGTAQGAVSVKGPLRTAAVTALLRADNVKAGDIRVPHATLAAHGNMGRVDVDKLEAAIGTPGGGGDALINGKGRLVMGKRNVMDSTVDLGVSVKGLELRPLLNQFMDSAPVGGVLDGSLNLKGTLAKPTLAVRVDSPLSVSQMIIDSMALNLSAPARDHYALNASARVGDFTLDLDGDVKRQGKNWNYTVKTRPVDVDKLIGVTAPEAKGLVDGRAVVRVNGVAPGDAPIGIRISLPKLTVIDKVAIQDIDLPITVSMKDNAITMREGQAVISEGLVRSKVDVDLAKSAWKGNVSVRRLNIGKLAAPFMPEGELVGTVEANADVKGSFGVFAQTFASGNFSTSSGYLHKLAILDRVTPTKRISFENIRGTFFWDGADLFLNPGSQATAGPDEPLYRYFAVNGSMGIPGKGLNLVCDGRFDLKILDQLLGAMKGIFQYMTGSLTGSGGYLRDAVGRMLGMKSRDYQNVSFTLANSWQELRLLNLKITKSIQDFLPIDQLNGNEEKQKDGNQFKLNLKFPTGPGNKNAEDVSTSDQFKEQLIDNLFRIGN